MAAQVRRRRRGLTRQGTRPAAPDLVKRAFTAPAPDIAWCGDMTEIRTDEGKLYLATVIDLYSRRILGYAMDHRHDAGLVVAEATFSTTKVEYVHRRHFRTRAEARLKIATWITAPPALRLRPALLHRLRTTRDRAVEAQAG
ncbi:DDE-type integrase/transposase/recombinase [Micromonospora sp. WMMD1102]|uniref:DDE-type integrase/transposase/recombinase n=1 Tax=Micromonospora sp. WMMD1102 TaxID=3016105 RepID=UPI0024153A76|nr:DDE-type integrase/transposase/recombinase [Micromonospora sp. WMMD1102]MDG4791741.1 DDE-type integrase/transposase/recombinase [Micromonospora sp. WMMD1102]